jgi:diguanylate cyclase (GGDEF)-like protein
MDKRDALNTIDKHLSKAVKSIRAKKYASSMSLQKTLNNSIKLNNKVGMAQFYSQLGKAKFSMSSFESSIENYIKAIHIYEELGDKKAIALINNNMGNVYITIMDFNKAIECFEKSRVIGMEIDNKAILLKSLTNCGLVNIKLKNPEVALKYYCDALDVCKSQGNSKNESNLLSEIGTLHVELKNFNEAIMCFMEVVKIETERNSVYGIAHANFRIAENNYWINNLDDAISYNMKALNVAREINNKPLYSYCCILFSNIYEKLGDYKAALKYLKDYSGAREEVLEADRVRKINEIQTKFEIYKKQKENEIQILKNKKLKEVNKGLEIAYKKAEQMANSDFLTKILNRRSIYKYINENFITKKVQFTIILSDIDDFKIINDSYGHDAGDFVLIETTERLQVCLGDEIKIARWGGEEFLIILPGMSLPQGITLAEKLRISINSSPYLYNGQSIDTSMTFGVYEYNGEDTFNEVIKKADSALYIGKSRGKNCVV